MNVRQMILLGENHIWLKALNGGLEKQELKRLIERVDALERYDRMLADSVLQVSVRANEQVVEELKKEESMCEALWEIMQPEINQAIEAAVKAAAGYLANTDSDARVVS